MSSILDGTKVIQEYLDGESALKLGKKYGVSKTLVLNYLRNNGVERRSSKDYVRPSPYHFNEHWLDNLDCQEKFYFLGFFAADGCNQPQYNSARIKLHQRDYELLNKFNLLLESDRPINKRTEIRKDRNRQDIAEISFTSKYFCSRLTELGMIQNKTKFLVFPDYIPKEYQSHYIRGVFDGDGCISVTQERNGCKSFANVCGTISVCEEIEKILKENNINCVFEISKTSENFARTCIRKQDQITALFHYMYKDANIYLQRKYDKFIEHINGREAMDSWKQEEKDKRDYKKTHKEEFFSDKAKKTLKLNNDKDIIIKRYLEGEETIDIANDYGVARITILRLLHKYNIQVRGGSV
jgi:hypothetical protein